MSTASWLILPFHLVVVPLQVALRHCLLLYEVHPGPSLPSMSARVSIDSCAWSTSAILRPRMASPRRPGFPRRRGSPKQTGQTLLENWQRKSDARSCYDFLLPGHIAADCTTDKEQAAALRVILEWLASTHEDVLPKHDARSAVRAWYRTNGVDFGRHDTEVLSLMTSVVNKAGLAVPKAGRPAVKRAVGRKTNPVNAVSSDDDSTSDSSSSSSCFIDFSFT
jgi:hypothetical protein